jgi:hypothetical protein
LLVNNIQKMEWCLDLVKKMGNFNYCFNKMGLKLNYKGKNNHYLGKELNLIILREVVHFK